MNVRDPLSKDSFNWLFKITNSRKRWVKDVCVCMCIYLANFSFIHRCWQVTKIREILFKAQRSIYQILQAPQNLRRRLRDELAESVRACNLFLKSYF